LAAPFLSLYPLSAPSIRDRPGKAIPVIAAYYLRLTGSKSALQNELAEMPFGFQSHRRTL
jgi:hypothetical protein